jgi:Zn-dependent protease with chaperone function
MRLPSLLLCASMAAVLPVAAAPRNLDDFEKRIVAELAAQRAEAVDVFVQANAAREKGDHATAARLYGVVHEMAPDFVHALRRQAGEVLALGDRPKAISMARRAVAAAASPENLSVLALSLSRETARSKPSAAERAEAVQVAERAAQQAPDDSHVQAALAQVALTGGDLPRLKQAVDRLLVVGADEETTYEFKAVLEASEGHFAAADEALEHARELGMPPDRYVALRAALREARPWTQRMLSGALWIAGAWSAVLALLVTAGFLLSGAALNAAARVPEERSGRAVGASAWVRRTYSVVLWLCCAFYYVSLPLVCAAVVLLGGGLIYGFIALGRVPIKLVAIIVILVLTTLWSIAKSLFVRGRDEDPGVRLNLPSHPRLRAVLQEVASRVGTAPVRSVYLTPGTDMAVMERGGLLRQLRGTAERCLILGVGVLEGMRVGPFKAVLAHEYGHFSNRDTAGGGFALAVRRSLVTVAVHLAQAGAAAWYNPAWLFLNVFHRVFLRVSQGASRLQEVLADRWAAFTYGAAAFEEGLRHVIERAVRFDAHADATLKEVLAQRQPLLNLYTHQPVAPPEETAVQKAVSDALNAKPSPYDSHPAPADRIRWVRGLAPRTAAAPGDEGEVWGLFDGRERIEQRLTGTVRENVLKAHGLRIAGRSEEPVGAAAR